MTVIGSLWEFGWNTPIKEFDLWHYPMREFGVDEIAMTPVSGIKNKVREFHSVEEMIQYYGLPVILCDELGETPLQRFEHPKEGALYLFGRTSRSLLGQYNYPSIKIETPEEKGMLWGHQAASIIMYDRFCKWQLQ